MLLEKGAIVDLKENHRGLTPLLFASNEGYEKVVKLLLDKGAKVDLKNSDGLTALMVASFEGHETVLKILVEKGANVDLKENNGDTALSMAKTKTIAKLLTAAGAR